MKKIVIVTTSLELGGITSFVINLANFLAEEGHEVTLMYTNDIKGIKSKFNDKIKLVMFNTLSNYELIFKVIAKGYIKDLIKTKFRNRDKVSPMPSLQKIQYVKALGSSKNNNFYDIAISSAEFFCNTYVAYNTNALKKIGWIHPDYEALNVDVEFDKKILNQLDKIITVSNDCENSLIKVIPEYQKKVHTIENILNIQGIINKSKEIIIDFDEDFDGLNIVTVCRLDNSSKRIDRAIKACQYLVDHKINFKWYLIGDGNDKEKIEKMVKDLNLADHFLILGSKINPYPYIKKADLFVLTSQYEGRPIVIDESLILNCPVIVTNYKSAKKQVKEEFGRVIPNNDTTIGKELLEVLKNTKQLNTWRKNLLNKKHSNEEAFQKLRSLIEEVNYDQYNSSNL